MTLARLFLLLTILPLIELALLLLMGKYISVWFTLAFVIITAMVGSVQIGRASCRERVWLLV